MPPADESRDRHRDIKEHRTTSSHRSHDSSHSRSHSRDARAQDAVRRETDAQPDALRHRPPTASGRTSAVSQSGPPPPPPAKPAAGVLGAGHRNAFALEAAKLLKARGAVSPVPATAAEIAEDPEDGELPAAPPVAPEQASKKRKHPPIIWQEGGKRPASQASAPPGHPSRSPQEAQPHTSASPSPATAATAVDAAGRAAAELAEFQDRQMGDGDDIDPDAPAAMKDSPSVSGDDEAGAASGAVITEVTSASMSMSLGHGVTVAAAVMTTRGNADSALAEVLDRVVPAPTSRWAAMIEEAPVRGASGEEAALDALNARERKELADGQGVQTPEHQHDRMSLDGSDASPGSDVTTGPSMLQQCREVQCFEKLNGINEGTYGMVYRAKEKQTGKIYALKKIKMERETEGFPLTSIREINILLALHHKNIVNVTEVVVGKKLDDVFMVMEFMEHDLKGLMEERNSSNPLFAMSEIKTLVRQLLEGVKYLHDNWVIHRDLKTSNILYNNKGDLKICDFGLARQYGSPLRPYTHMVVTLWYRAPELLLGVKEYSTAIDMWSVGCIMGELILNAPLLSGKSEMEQIHKIFNLVGSPTAENWPKHQDLPNLKRFKFPACAPNLESKFPVRRFDFDGRTLSEAGFDLLSSLLTLDPERRATAQEALEHKWFKEAPFPKDLPMMPTFPVKQGEGSHHHKRHHHQPSPRQQPKAASASAALLQPNSRSR